MKKSFAEILSDIKSSSEARLAEKIPQWAAAEGLEIPSSINCEQCSSEATALYKAGIAAGLSEGRPRIADLTGGLGVDSWAFSGIAEAVLHNEADRKLSEAVERNFKRLGVANAEFSSFLVAAGSDGWLEKLNSFRPDIIYLDPARRNAGGGKVFLLEDCSPDVTSIMPSLLEICSHVIIKVSPMADLSMLRKRLPFIRSVDLVASRREMKEILITVEKGFSSDPEFRIPDLSGLEETFRFTGRDIDMTSALFADALPEPGTLLFEPCASAMKSGAFELFSSRFGLKMLGRDSHLYTGADDSDVPGHLFKRFEVEECVPWSGSTLKEFASRHVHADVTARGIPMSSEELKERLRCKSGREHIFGTTFGGKKILIAAKSL